MPSPPVSRTRVGVDIGGTFYDRYRLVAGLCFDGPAIVEERESTTVIGPRARITVDARLNLVAEPIA
jgi:N-methylhydantoinase A/oxoprolinase/acetone carboxylase beta subunit